MFVLYLPSILVLGRLVGKSLYILLSVESGQFTDFYPNFFIKKRRGYCNCLHPSFMLSPKPLDKIQPKWCVSYSHEWGVQQHNYFWPRPLGPWGGVKRSNIFKFQLQSQFQRFFITNFVFVLTNKRYKTYQMGFSFYRLGHAPGVGCCGCPGGQKNLFRTWSCHSCGISN